LADFCAFSPERLIGCGVAPCHSPDETVRNALMINRAGLRGVMLPLEPPEGRYADPDFDILWSAAVDYGLPITFHALPPRRRSQAAGPAAAAFLQIWEAQELLAGLIFGGVLHRFPALKLVFAEFDAGWVPHFVQRLDHYFRKHHRWLKLDGQMDALPSDYVRRSIYFTFQDDETALRTGPRAGVNLMWGSDFPHAESTWPSSREVLNRAGMVEPPVDVQPVFSGNVANLYGLPD
jgi:predicted TIM-barrel fold metal-dependent hydrolase